MSKGFESQEGTLNKDAVEWTSKVRKLLLGISDVKLNKVDTNVPHTAQKDLEDLTESRERTESRLRKKDELRTEEIEKQQKLLDKARKVEQLRHDAIRDGESTLTVGKAIKSGCHGSVSFLTSDTGVPLVIKTPNSDSYQKELENEANLYAKIGDHENIVRCYGIQETSDGSSGLVLERIEGRVEVDGAFRKLDAQFQSGKVTYAEYMGTIQNVMRQLLTGLAKLEECGISHNDIKDDNVMIDAKTGVVKIIDIGLATEHGEDAKTGATFFQAPDKYGGKSKANDDSYSAGAILQNMVEGRIKLLSANSNEKAVDVVEGEIQSREEGKAAWESEYVKFINALSNPDPSKRLKPSEALNHPFLTESLLDEESANTFLTSFLGDQPDRKEIKFKSVEGFTSTAFTETYNNAVSAGAVPEAVALSVAAAKSLDLYTDDSSDNGAKQNALQSLLETLKRLQSVSAYAEHPDMSSYLNSFVEQARAELKSCREQLGDVSVADITFTVPGPTFDAGCWGTAYQNAVAAGAVEPDPKAAAAIRDSFAAFRLAKQSFEKQQNWYELRSAANYAIESLTQLGKNIEAIRKLPGYSENVAMAGLLQYFTDQIPLQRAPFDSFKKNPVPFTVVDGFSKDAFEKTYQNAVKAMAVPDCKAEMQRVVDRFSEYENVQPQTQDDKASWEDRANAARAANKALVALEKAIGDLVSAFRKAMGTTPNRYLDELKKQCRPLEEQYAQLATWSESLKGVAGLESDSEAVKQIIAAAADYQEALAAYKAFERCGDWNNACDQATTTLELLQTLLEDLESLNSKYPDALAEQKKDVATKSDALTAFLDHGLEFVATKAFSSAAWATTYKTAANNVAVPRSDVDANAVTTGLKQYEDNLPTYRNEAADWDDRDAAGSDALDGLTNARDAIGRLLTIDIYRKNPVMGPHLTWLNSAINEELKLLQVHYDKFTSTGKIEKVDSDFRTHWQNAKQLAEADFNSALPNMAGVNRRTKFSKYLPLDSGLSPALKDFEKACEDDRKRPNRKTAAKKKSTYDKVEKIIAEYRKKLINESRKPHAANIDSQYHFWARLLKALNEILVGVQKMMNG